MQETSSEPSSKLWIKILIGMGLGILAGLILPHLFEAASLSDKSQIAILDWVGLPGALFISLLKMIIVPLVITSVILGIAEAGSMSFLKSMGLRTVPYFIMTTIIAVTIGLTITSIVRPGDAIQSEWAEQAMAEQQASTSQSNIDQLASLTIPDRIMNMIPTNPSSSIIEKDMLQIVILSIIIGIIVVQLSSKETKSFRELCVFGQTASMKVVSWAMAFAPLAVFSLMAGILAQTGFEALTTLGLYVFCVIAGLLTMLAVYLTFVLCIARRSPLDFLACIRNPQIIAFSTSSSAATMPVSLKAAEEKLKLEGDIFRFVIPLGATINMDGTALYQATAALFLCQVFGIDLSLSEMVLLVMTTVGASIGTPAMPGVGIVVLATILTGIGVPPEGVGLILAVDRILDMCRTTINVTGDLTAATVLQAMMPQSKTAN